MIIKKTSTLIAKAPMALKGISKLEAIIFKFIKAIPLTKVEERIVKKIIAHEEYRD